MRMCERFKFSFGCPQVFDLSQQEGLPVGVAAFSVAVVAGGNGVVDMIPARLRTFAFGHHAVYAAVSDAFFDTAIAFSRNEMFEGDAVRR